MVTKKTAKKPAAKTTKKPLAKTTLATKAPTKTKSTATAKVVAKNFVKSTVKPAVSKATVELGAKLLQKPTIAPQQATKPATKTIGVKSPVAKAPASRISTAKAAAPTAAASKTAVPVAPKVQAFKIGELVVYPAHGVGRVSNVETQEIAGTSLELYIVDFEKEKLRLKVPTNRAEQKGMRHLADRAMIEQAMKVIRGRARIKRVMWSRRAQEYDAKINSGDLIAVAEVVRDLYRSERQPEQSYSERQLFEQALARFARELAAVRKIDDDQCIKELEDFLARNAKRAAADKSDEEAAEEAA
jgi:CarD family transcriptional regulator